MATLYSSNSVFLNDLQQGFLSLFGGAAPGYWESFAALAKEVLGAIATSDAPYHTVEHTQQVLVVGQTLLQGRHLHSKAVTPHDWMNVMVALLCHDIGYLRGLCPEDDLAAGRYSIGQPGQTAVLLEGRTDACLGPYHVDRGRQFVTMTLRQNPLIDLDRVLTCIELTRFPVPKGTIYQDTIDYPGLCRAADLIGQLSDPRYLKKLPALYCEFEETGMNQILGYSSAADLRASYPHFYWCVVFPYIRDCLRYLAATQGGRQIIARLYTNVYLVELEQQRTDSTSPALKEIAGLGRHPLPPQSGTVSVLP
ncbi:MAG TPA: metal-dependent phosphohydrolase [Trichocoleus sp.]